MKNIDSSLKTLDKEISADAKLIAAWGSTEGDDLTDVCMRMSQLMEVTTKTRRHAQKAKKKSLATLLTCSFFSFSHDHNIGGRPHPAGIFAASYSVPQDHQEHESTRDDAGRGIINVWVLKTIFGQIFVEQSNDVHADSPFLVIRHRIARRNRISRARLQSCRNPPRKTLSR